MPLSLPLYDCALWIFWTIRYAKKTKTDAKMSERLEDQLDWRSGAILAIVVLTFAIMVYGIFNWHWDFNQMSGLFFIMGIVVGLLGKLSLNGTMEAYIRGFRDMAFAGLLIGFARAIYVVLDDGMVIDTIVHGLFTPIANLPDELSAIGMIVAHAGSLKTRGTLNSTSSLAVSTCSTFTSNRARKASMTSFTSTSGALAPAVMPMARMPARARQSISSARWTSCA